MPAGQDSSVGLAGTQRKVPLAECSAWVGWYWRRWAIEYPGPTPYRALYVSTRTFNWEWEGIGNWYNSCKTGIKLFDGTCRLLSALYSTAPFAAVLPGAWFAFPNLSKAEITEKTFWAAFIYSRAFQLPRRRRKKPKKSTDCSNLLIALYLPAISTNSPWKSVCV